MSGFQFLGIRFLFMNARARFRMREEKEEEEEERPEDDGTNRTKYIFSMISYAVGLGHIWRFPYLVYKNGGGAFLVAYFLMTVFTGAPFFFLESALGQFCSQGPVNAWSVVPIFQGVGISMVVVNAIVSIYYNVIISYSLYYFFASFQSPVPWADCFSWANSNCSEMPTVYCNISGVLVANWTEENITCPLSDKVTVQAQSPSEQYWDRVALQRSSGLSETGLVLWQLALCLLLSSGLVAVALIRGIKSSGKVVYCTALFPHVVILMLLVRGATLEGAGAGIDFYIGSQSNWSKLAEGQIWKDAATQTFFSQSVAFGGVTALASYNNFNNNIYSDTLILTLTNFGTSVFAGFAIFSILGHMSHVYGRPVCEVVQEGFGLAFIAYPKALAELPISPFMSILFFFMLFIVGLDSQFVIMEVITTTVLDALPKITRSIRSKTILLTCAIVYLLGLPCVTNAGIYWLTLLDQFSVSWVVLVLALMELIGICFIYGGNTFIEDTEMMIGEKSPRFWTFWKVCWFYITPCIILVVLVWSLITFVPPTYGGVQFPWWGLALGWSMDAFILIWIPVIALYKLAKAEGNLWKRVKTLCCPSEQWRPHLEINWGERYSEEQSQNQGEMLTND